MRDMTPLLLGNLGAKFSETSFPHFWTILCKLAVIFGQQLITFNSNSLCLQRSLSKIHGPGKEKLCKHRGAKQNVLELLLFSDLLSKYCVIH